MRILITLQIQNMKADHCGFQVKNMDKAILFYTEKLGFTLDFRGVNGEEKEEYAFISLGNARIELIRDMINEYELPAIKKPYCPHYCIEIEDMVAAVKELQAKNIRIIKGPLKIEHEETWVYFADEDNNVLEYIQWYNKK